MWLVFALALIGCAPSGGTEGDVLADACREGELRDDAGVCVPAQCGASLQPDADVVVEEGQSIQEAVNALGRGTVGLGAGTWSETLTLGSEHAGLAIVGRCPQLTIVDGSAGADDSAVVTLSARAVQEFSLASLTVRGGRHWGIEADYARLNLADVDVADNEVTGVLAGPYATLRLERVTITDTTADKRNQVGHGLSVETGAVVDASDLRIRNSAGAGVYVYRGTFTATDLAVSGTVDASDTVGAGLQAWDASVAVTRGELSMNSAVGVLAGDGSEVTLDDVQIAQNGDLGVVSTNAGTAVSVSASAVSANGFNAEAGAFTAGVLVSEGAALNLDDVDVVGNADLGVFAGGAGTIARITGGRILDTQSVRLGDSGVGLAAQGGAEVTAMGVLIDGNAGVGVSAAESHTAVFLSDSQVSDTETDAEGGWGVGLSVDVGATLSGYRLVISGNHDAGAQAIDGAQLWLDDTVIRDTQVTEGSGIRAGVSVIGGAVGALRRCVLDRNAVGGARADGSGSLLRLEDVTISHTVRRPELPYATGVLAFSGSRVEAKNLAVIDSLGLAMGFGGPGTSASLEGLTISGVGHDDTVGGQGLNVMDGALVRANGVLIEDVSEAAVLGLGEGTVLDFSHVLVRRVEGSPAIPTPAAIVIQRFAALTLDSYEISEVEGPGLVALTHGVIACADCSISGASFAGVIAMGGTVQMMNSEVSDTVPDASSGGGVGAFVNSSFGMGNLELVNTTISGNPLAAVWMEGENTVDITGGALTGGEGVPIRDGLNVHGNAIFAHALGDGDLVVRDTRISGSADAGVLLDDATGSFFNDAWSENAVDLVQQECGELSPPLGVGGQSTELCPDAPRLTLGISFTWSLVESEAASE